MFIERKLKLERTKTLEYDREGSTYDGEAYIVKLHNLIIGNIQRICIDHQGCSWKFTTLDIIDKGHIDDNVGHKIALHIQRSLPKCNISKLFDIDKWLVKNIVALYRDKLIWVSRSPEEHKMIAKTLERIGMPHGRKSKHSFIT